MGATATVFHLSASYLLAADVDDRPASDRLGHADPAYMKRASPSLNLPAMGCSRSVTYHRRLTSANGINNSEADARASPSWVTRSTCRLGRQTLGTEAGIGFLRRENRRMPVAWVRYLLRPLLDARVWAALAVGIVLGAAGTALLRPPVPPPAPVSGIPGVGEVAAAAAAAARAPGPYYIVVEKHYVDPGGRDDRANWFYGTVRNAGTSPGTCSVIATFFDEDDRALESTVIPLQTLVPGQQVAFRTHPHTQNVGSAGASFTAPCGRGIMWHYIP